MESSVEIILQHQAIILKNIKDAIKKNQAAPADWNLHRERKKGPPDWMTFSSTLQIVNIFIIKEYCGSSEGSTELEALFPNYIFLI